MRAEEALERGYRTHAINEPFPYKVEGVEVTYEDGYKSWCPLETFKKHNHVCEGLAETALLMVSDDYKERFKAEYNQLKIRYDKLKDMLLRWDLGDVDMGFTPTCPRSAYDLQIKAMEQYLAVLEMRAKIEGVEL